MTWWMHELQRDTRRCGVGLAIAAIVILLVVALTRCAVGAETATPVGHFAEEVALPNGQRQMTIYAYPRYYRDGAEWKPTVERFAGPAGEYVAEATQGVHRARVRADGTVRMEHLDGAITQRLTGIAAVNPVGLPTKIWQIDLSAWARVVDGNRVTWTNGDWLYEVIYGADSLTTRLTIPVSAFAALKKFLPPGSVAFGPIGDWDESGLGADWTCDAGDACDTTAGIGYLKNGVRVQSVRAARVGAKDDNPGWAKRRIRSKANRSLVESIPVVALDGGEPLVFNDSITYQQGVLPDAGYSGCTDNSMDENQPTTNRGTATFFAAGSYSAVAPVTGNRYRSLLAFDVSGVLGTVTDAYYTLQCYSALDTIDISFFRVLKPWEELDSTFNRWDHSGANEWGAAGCESADDAGVENAGDGTGADRKATAAFIATNQSGTGAKTLGAGEAGLRSLVQGWIDGTATDTYGVLLRRTNPESSSVGHYQIYYSANYATDTGLRPKLAITYSVGPAIPVIEHHRRQQEAWRSRLLQPLAFLYEMRKAG